MAGAHGADGVVEIVPGEPVLRNHPAIAALVREAATAVLGPGGVVEIARPEMVGEDFAFYVERVPGAMFRLGVRNVARDAVYPLHDARFDLDEDALAVGAAVFREAAGASSAAVGEPGSPSRGEHRWRCADTNGSAFRWRSTAGGTTRSRTACGGSGSTRSWSAVPRTSAT